MNETKTGSVAWLLQKMRRILQDTRVVTDENMSTIAMTSGSIINWIYELNIKSDQENDFMLVPTCLDTKPNLPIYERLAELQEKQLEIYAEQIERLERIIKIQDWLLEDYKTIASNLMDKK